MEQLIRAQFLHKNKNEAATKVSLQVLDKHEESFTNGELIRLTHCTT